VFDKQEGSMGTRSQPPDVTAPMPAQPDAPPPGTAAPGPAPVDVDVDVDSEFASQLDELSRCLVRMDAVVSMLEADLERRVATWRALAPEILSMLAAVAEPRQQPRQQPKKGRRRVAAVMSEQARRGR
jgi:hypothetical protein